VQSCKNASAEEKIFPFHQRPFLRFSAIPFVLFASHFLAKDRGCLDLLG